MVFEVEKVDIDKLMREAEDNPVEKVVENPRFTEKLEEKIYHLLENKSFSSTMYLLVIITFLIASFIIGGYEELTVTSLLLTLMFLFFVFISNDMTYKYKLNIFFGEIMKEKLFSAAVFWILFSIGIMDIGVLSSLVMAAVLATALSFFIYHQSLIIFVFFLINIIPTVISFFVFGLNWVNDISGKEFINARQVLMGNGDLEIKVLISLMVMVFIIELVLKIANSTTDPRKDTTTNKENRSPNIDEDDEINPDPESGMFKEVPSWLEKKIKQ